jgi:hypothetical protein
LALWWISVLQAVQGFVLRCTRVAGPVGAVGIDVERRISFGVGIPPRDFTNEDLFSSQMMSMHNSTHSSQMNTVGPAMSLRTSCWLLPQNEQ